MNYRLFETSLTRRQWELDGRWAFLPGGDEKTMAAFLRGEHDATTHVPVPCAWNSLSEHYDLHGEACYRRTFTLQEPTSLRFQFGGVSHEATIYLDGDRRIEHEGGYTEFEFTTPELEAGQHVLALRVNSQWTSTTVPSAEGTDWFMYGGITREVEIEEIPPVRIDQFDITYELSDESASVEASVTVENTGESREQDLRFELGENSTATRFTLPAGSSTHTLELGVADVDRWEPEDPTLYDVSVSLHSPEGEITDDRQDRIGFRTVDIDGRDILLNGRPIELRGVNRHEDHPEWGHTQPLRLMMEDIEHIRDAGVNFVRCSHYPNHPRFLDLCDEAGLLVLEELPYWQFDAEDFGRERNLEKGVSMLTEMIDRDRHHPSIITWGVTNECANDEDGVVAATEELVQTARECDDSRLVTLASMNDAIGKPDRCLSMGDFVCVNCYIGWYKEGRVSRDQWVEYLDGVAENYDEPIVVSEFGAGAIRGERTWERQKWSEPYQSDVLETSIPVFREHDATAGFAVWQYCDTKTSKEMSIRPRSKNNKGILDEYHLPKEGYWTLVSLLNDERVDS